MTGLFGPMSVDYMASVGSEHVTSLGYDAIAAEGRRRAPSGINASEDVILKQRGRDLATSQNRDVYRNFALTQWAIGKHLDFNTQIDFHANAGDKYGSFDDDLTFWVMQKAKKEAFDAARRHPLWRYLRMLEARSLLDGDLGNMQLATGHLQSLEGDRIRNAPGADPRWENGVLKGPAGMALAYGVWDRAPKTSGYVFNRSVPANRFYLHAHYGSFDQGRGISPLMSAINSMQDVYEGIDYTLAKMKVEQLFAMAIFRKAETSGGNLLGDDSTGTGRRKYQVDFGKGPILLDLDPGDEAKFLKSDSPGANSREFLMTVIMLSLKALDIPFSFFDESFTNFFGSRGSWMHYERSCVAKRANICDFLNWWFQWRIVLGVQDGEIRIPRGLTLARPFWEWYPSGMPWWDPVKEINGDNASVLAGYNNPQRVTKERGKGDWYKNIDARAEAEAYARKKGVQVSWGTLPTSPQDEQDHKERDKPEGSEKPAEKTPPARQEGDE